MRDPCEILPLVFLNAVVELNGEPFFFDDFVVGATVENVCVAIDFVAFAHGNFASEFFGKQLANGGDFCFGDVFAIAHASKIYAYAVAHFAERKSIAFVRKFGIRSSGKHVCFTENRTNDAVFVIHCDKDN